MKQYIRYFLIQAICFLIYNNIEAQSLQVPEHRETIHSPQVTLINQFGDYPVDLSNGLVDISIPLYEIKTPGLSMPLSLKFHPSGLRHDERESFFGLRWVLGGLGHVSRVIKGYPDEYHSRYPLHESINNPNYKPDFFSLFGTTSTMYSGSGQSYNSVFITMGGQYKDTEYDVFSYSLPSGKSGKFILTGAGEVVETMPYEPIKIVVGRESDRYGGVTITDENGITYNYQMSESDENGFATAFHLKKITSANKQDVITIDYEKSDLRTYVRSENTVTSDDLHDNSPYAWERDLIWGEYPSPIYAALSGLFNDKYKYFNTSNYSKHILCDQYCISTIRIESGGELTSLVDFYYTSAQSNVARYLEEIMVNNANGDLVKYIYFTLKNNESNKFKLLDKIEIMPWSDSKEVYTFDYYDSYYAPACSDLSKNFDWWGYYSEGAGAYYAQDIALSIPSQDTGRGDSKIMKMEGGHKTPNGNSMSIGMIKEITYPTGGRTQFEYEVNGDNLLVKNWVGGLRIKQIHNISGSGKTESKYYEYKNAVLPSYLSTPYYNTITMENEIECYYISPALSGLTAGHGYGRYLQTTYLKSFPSEYTQFHSNVISYGHVTEYFGPSAINNTGKIEYKYNIGNLQTDFYKDRFGYDFQSTYSGYTRLHVSPADFWKKNHLYSKIIYKSTGKGPDIQYKEVEKYDYTYKTFKEKNIYDMPVYRYRYHQVIVPSGHNDEQIEIDLIYPYKDLFKDVFAYVNQRYTSGAEKLVKETKYAYHDNGTQTTVREFDYDGTYLLPITEKVTNSDGSVYSNSTKYSFHKAGSPYTEMMNANMFTNITEKNVEKDGVSIERLVYTYNDKTTINFISYWKKNEMKDQISYSFHDSNSLPGVVSKNSNEVIVYIRNIYGNIVAEILNAHYYTVASALGGVSVIDRISKSTQVSDADMLLLNNLRKALPDAHVYTYTLRPLIGMISVTDPKGYSTYYEYDDANKLEWIKDDKRNILEQYEYNYSIK